MSYLAGLTREGTDYVDADGCHYQDAESALAGVLGFCGCGRPDDALRFIRRVLLWVNEKHTGDFDSWYKGWRKRGNELFHSDVGFEYTVLYLLDNKGLTEHGGSVPGWLSGLGEDVLDDLNELYSD